MIGKKTLHLFAVFIMLSQFALWHGIGSWNGTKSIRPGLEIVPAVPSKEMLKAFSFGDEEITFRYNGYMMQFLGDTFGRVTALKDYNYERLYRWWLLLDEINPISDLIVYVVGYYYGATQDKAADLPYVVDFLEQHADKHPELKWWWYYQAVYNAKYGLKDEKRALEIAHKLASLPKDVDMPIWTRQLEAFIYEGQGEYKQACDVIVNVVRDYGDDKIAQGEMNFIFNFITERLRTLINKESSIDKADISPECRAMMDVQKANDMKDKLKNFDK
jgi:tetratricopeptide (TPR) repeat protein